MENNKQFNLNTAVDEIPLRKKTNIRFGFFVFFLISPVHLSRNSRIAARNLQREKVILTPLKIRRLLSIL